MSGLKLLLKDVILELQNSSKFPIIVDDNEIKIQNTGVFMCDASARTSAKCIKSHSGNDSYEWCIVNQEYHGDHVCLTHISGNFCADKSFKNQSDVYHRTGNSMLCEYGIKMLSESYWVICI